MDGLDVLHRAQTRVEIALPESPDWTSFELMLVRTGHLSVKGWEKFMREALR